MIERICDKCGRRVFYGHGDQEIADNEQDIEHFNFYYEYHELCVPCYTTLMRLVNSWIHSEDKPCQKCGMVALEDYEKEEEKEKVEEIEEVKEEVPDPIENRPEILDFSP